MQGLKKVTVLVMVSVVIMMMVGVSWAENEVKSEVTSDVKKININTAKVEELIQLQLIGPKYAEKIVQYRKENGLFKKVEDIINVKGIGPKILEVNSGRLSVK